MLTSIIKKFTGPSGLSYVQAMQRETLYQSNVYKPNY